MRRGTGDDGAAIPLIVGLFAVAAGFVVVAAGATSLHLERLRLLTVADGAALAGAESFQVADATVHWLRPILPVQGVSGTAEFGLAEITIHGRGGP